MSYIPNSAMPHARSEEDDARDARFDLRGYADQVLSLARDGLRAARRHPREAAGTAVALVAGLGLAAWRRSRKSRRRALA